MFEKSTLSRRTALLFLASAVVGGCGGMGLLQDIDSLMKEGQRLYAEKKYDEAISKFTDVVTRDFKHWPAYVWLARSFVAKGQWGDAIANARKAFDLAPSGTEAVKMLAEALLGGATDAMRRGQLAESIPLFREYLKFEGNNTSAWLNLAKAYWQSGDRVNALDAFRQVLRLEPRNAEALNFLSGR